MTTMPSKRPNYARMRKARIKWLRKDLADLLRLLAIKEDYMLRAAANRHAAELLLHRAT